jgi:hypothetical protein
MIALNEIETNDLLAAFVTNYNDEQEAHEQTVDQLAALNDAFQLQGLENNTLKDKVEAQGRDLNKALAGLLDAEKLANLAIAQKRELALSRSQLSTAQQTITTLNSANPNQLKEQVKRVKAKSEEKDKINTGLKSELKQIKHKLKLAEEDKHAAKEVVELMRVNADKSKILGLYHSGDHHLVIWPQRSKIQRKDGSEFDSTNLLYLHQSGRGGFITFDPVSGESKLCAAPKGGLRPSSETISFAHNWLHKVNQEQNGHVEDEDRAAIDYNGRRDA